MRIFVQFAIGACIDQGLVGNYAHTKSLGKVGKEQRSFPSIN